METLLTAMTYPVQDYGMENPSRMSSLVLPMKDLQNLSMSLLLQTSLPLHSIASTHPTYPEATGMVMD